MKPDDTAALRGTTRRAGQALATLLRDSQHADTWREWAEDAASMPGPVSPATAAASDEQLRQLLTQRLQRQLELQDRDHQRVVLAHLVIDGDLPGAQEYLHRIGFSDDDLVEEVPGGDDEPPILVCEDTLREAKRSCRDMGGALIQKTRRTDRLLDSPYGQVPEYEPKGDPMEVDDAVR